jgi:hypothetical protein
MGDGRSQLRKDFLCVLVVLRFRSSLCGGRLAEVDGEGKGEIGQFVTG